MTSAARPAISERSSGSRQRQAAFAKSVDVVTTRATVDSMLLHVGLSWVEIGQRASEVVLFGSRAAGLADTESDWDLLLVGDGKGVHTNEIDLVWVSADRITSEHWLGSELANHVAVYGRWLRGSGAWRHNVVCSAEAAARKKTALLFQLNQLRRVWPDLLAGAKVRHLRRLRRDVQRLHLLSDGTAVPPTPLLDKAWCERESPPQDLRDLFAELGAFHDEVFTVTV